MGQMAMGGKNLSLMALISLSVLSLLNSEALPT